MYATVKPNITLVNGNCIVFLRNTGASILGRTGFKTKLGTARENQQSAYAKLKAQISCAEIAQLISAFVFATRIV